MTTKVDIEFRARLDELRKEMDSIPGLTKKAAREIEKEWSRATKEAEKLAKKQQAEFQKAREEVEKSIPGLSRLRQGYEQITSTLDGLGVSTTAAKVGLGALIIGGAAVAKGLYDAGQAAIAWTRDATTMADQAGVTADQIAGLRVATTRAQKDFGAAVGGLQKFTKTLTDAAIKGGEAGVFFRRLGVDVGDAQRGVKGTSEALSEVVSRLGEMTDATEKARIMSALFGAAAGADLVDALTRAGGSLDDLTKDAAKYGLTLDQDTIKATTQYDEAVGRLDLTLQGMKITIGKQVVPALNNFLTGLSAVLDPTRSWGELLDGVNRSLARLGRFLGAAGGVSVAGEDWSKLGQKIKETKEEGEKLGSLPADAFVGPVLNLGKAEEPVKRVTRAVREQVVAVKDLSKEWVALNKATAPDMTMRKEAAATNAIMQRIEAIDTERINTSKLFMTREEAIQSIVNNTAAASAAIGDLIGQQFAAEAAKYRDGSRLQREALKKQFAANKAFALAQAGINTALAISQAIATNAGNPIALGIAVGLASVLGLAQVAAIAAAKPPKFHRGGMAPDESPAVLRAGEAVLTPSAANRIGGEDGVRRLNRGEAAAPSSSVVVVQLGHEVVGAAVERHMARPDAPVRRAMRRGMPAGRRMAGGVV
jgi:hypothetical protein